MKPTSIADLKARLSAYLDVVRRGGEVLVTDRGQPIARIAPVDGQRRLDSRVGELVRSGQLITPTAKLPKGFWTRRHPADPEGRSVAAILEERDAGW